MSRHRLVLQVHGSSNNVSPLPRSIFYLNYNACSNRTPSDQNSPGRGWWHCNTDATPLRPLADNCLEEVLIKEEVGCLFTPKL